jgi:hypothetical protein
MKKVFIGTFLAIISLCGFSQEQLKTTQPQPLSLKEQELLMSLPDLVMPESYKNKTLPYKIDHSESEHFRDMFVQSGMSCGQASSTGVCFTYEMNAARNLEANVNSHLYPTGFVYNWDAGDWGGSGVSYYHTLEVLRMVGTPNQEEYGGTIDAGGNIRWMTGYDLYYSTMKNRITGAYKLNVGDAAGLQIFKNWMNDHLNGDDDGGCAIFYSGVPSPTETLPAGTEEAGKFVLTDFYAGTSHSMAILGYNDSIRFDYNNDGQYTNNIDINGDSQVTMADWEIGGIKMCNTYSGGPAWANGGFCYIMYKNIADGSFWNDVVHVMTVNPTYDPQLTAKVNITYNRRKKIKVYAGISINTSASMPEHVIDLPILDYQAGDNFMTGGTTESDKTMEFGIDLTPLLNFITPGQEAKYFIQVYENDADGTGTGTLNSFSLINYSSGSPVETVCSSPAQTIAHNGITTLSITSSQTYDPVEITTTSLSSGAIMSPFSQQLTADGGTEPYTWGFDMDFSVAETIETFPTGGTTLSGSGFFSVPLGFTFNYYGQDYTNIYVSSKGMVVFASGFSDNLPYYHHDETVWIHTKSIAPFYTSTVSSTMKSISGAGFKTIIWDNSTIDFAMTLYDDGRIVFNYTNSVLTSLVQYVCGTSNGDQLNYQRLAFDSPATVSSGFTYTLTPFLIPNEFEISTTGLLEGIPTHEYLAEDFHFKVVDNNGIRDKITLPFVTDGLILSYAVNTPDDAVIEYAETVSLDLTATNPMAGAVTGITITVTTSDPYITITDNSTTCPDLNSGSNQVISDAFTFDVSPSVPDNHQFQLDFTVTSDQDVWNYFYLFNAFAPNIITEDIVVDDGNDDILAAGETADISIPILNDGGSDVHNLTITASTSDSYITINTDTDIISTLEPNQTEIALFNITAASIVENQHIAIVNLTFAGDNGYSEVVPVEIVINTAVLNVMSSMINDGDNNCLDPGETADAIFNLKNLGLVSATNITATLSTADPMVTINTGAQNIASLLAGNSTLLTYNISVDPTCDMGHIVELTLNAVADNGLNTDITVYLIVGILMETFESGNLDTFEWTQPEASDWYVVTDEVYDGTYSLRSGAIGDSQQSTLQIEMFVVADGNVSFARKVSSENYYDFLEFLVDGVVVYSLSGEMAWAEYSHPVLAGQHTFAWRYRKDINTVSGLDAAWIDNIIFPAVSTSSPMLFCETTEIFKTMNTNQEEYNPLTISNLGGGILDFNVEVVPESIVKKSIEGSTLVSDLANFEPGETYTVTFSLTAQSSDMEWVKNLIINFPDEVTVNSSTDLIGPSGTLNSDASTGAGIDLEFSTTQTWGAIHENETATCTVNITFDENYTGEDSQIGYTITGDIYGGEPHSVSSVISLPNQAYFWLNVDPSNGEITSGSDFELSLHYNTAGMAEGVYYADIVISDATNMITIPVELTIDFLAGISVETNNEFSIWPNPFSSEINLNYNSPINDVADIKIFDITGKLIEIPIANQIVKSGDNTFTINSLELLPAGMYLVKLETSKTVVFRKIVRE